MEHESVRGMACNLCGNHSVELVEEHVALNVVKCRVCGLVFLRPLPKMRSLSEHYDENYFKPWIQDQQLSRERLWMRRLALVDSYRQGGRILDVGCGDGSFLRLARQGGRSVAGTELSAWACSYVSRKYEIPVMQGDLVSMESAKHAQFDIITMWHVLEHMPDPLGNLKRAAAMLDGNGLLIVEVPNVNDHLFRFAYRIARGRSLQLYHDDERELHLYHFSVTTLKAMLEKAGLRVLRTGSGVDSQVEWSKRFLDRIASVFSIFSSQCIGTTIMAVAAKAPESSVSG